MLLPALIVFFVSGFAALLYQVVWQRLLVIFSGADVYSATLVVTAFMAGLGTGNLAGGHVADRVPPRASLVLFGVAELAIAGFGLISRPLYYDFLYERLGHVDLPAGGLAAILLASLLWPTFFMGASLPLLARALTRQLHSAAPTIGALYGVNTLGAAAGALAATWWLLPRIGLDESLRLGAMLNIGCAAIVMPLALVQKRLRAHDGRVAREIRSPPQDPSSADQGSPPFWMWASLYAFTGLLALSLEIVWFRLLGVMMKSTAFTFGTLLALYLCGLGLGAVAGSVLASRVRRPAAAFLSVQAAAGLSACLLLAILVASVDRDEGLTRYFASYEPLNVKDEVTRLGAFLTGARGSHVPWSFLRMYWGLPALLIVPPTFLMGASFPLIQRVVQNNLARVGRRVGHLLLANIMGSMLGSVLTGWVALDLIGTAATLKVLAALSGLLIVVAIALPGRHERSLNRRAPAQAMRAAIAGAAVMALVVWLPGAGRLWARLHGTSIDHMVFAEDGSGVSVIKTRQDGVQGRVVVFVNGLGQSGMPYGDIHTALGAIPAFVHPDPRDAAVIGLGSGDTVHAVAGRPDIQRLVCIEIIRPQLDTLVRLARRFSYGGLETMLNDRRIEHVFGDGRMHLRRAGRTYDIIEADALRPTSAYAGNLYSDAYFELVRDHLKPHGIAATWPPTVRVAHTFMRVFPHVVSLPGILLGSRDPIRIDRAAIAARIATPGVREYYSRARIDIERLVEHYLAQPVTYGPELDRSTLTDVNTDLFPKDEFDLGR